MNQVEAVHSHFRKFQTAALLLSLNSVSKFARQLAPAIVQINLKVQTERDDHRRAPNYIGQFNRSCFELVLVPVGHARCTHAETGMRLCPVKTAMR